MTYPGIYLSAKMEYFSVTSYGIIVWTVILYKEVLTDQKRFVYKWSSNEFYFILFYFTFYLVMYALDLRWTDLLENSM